MTQDEAWKKNYDEVMAFITENGRNLSKYNLEERRLYTWLKHQRKVMNAGEMKEARGWGCMISCYLEVNNENQGTD